jgi:hypothetical protein
MKLTLDENLPESLVPTLETLRHHVLNVRLQGLHGEPDLTMWQVAQGEERFVTTQDLDFAGRRQYLPGTHHGPMPARLSRPGRRVMAACGSPRCFWSRSTRVLQRLFAGSDGSQTPRSSTASRSAAAQVLKSGNPVHARSAGACAAARSALIVQHNVRQVRAKTPECRDCLLGGANPAACPKPTGTCPTQSQSEPSR